MIDTDELLKLADELKILIPKSGRAKLVRHAADEIVNLRVQLGIAKTALMLGNGIIDHLTKERDEVCKNLEPILSGPWSVSNCNVHAIAWLSDYVNRSRKAEAK